MLFHGKTFDALAFSPVLSSYLPFQSWVSVGAIGVDVFLFLSGMGLYYAMRKQPPLRVFYKNRLKRILIPYLQRCVDARGWASILEGSLVGELLHLRERHLLVYRSDPSALFRGTADPAALPRPLSHGHALRPIRVLSRSDAVLRCPSG